jgi:hypothetical protein
MHKLATPHPIRCRCGRLQGQLAQGASVARVACYCIDCQSYAHALGKPEIVLDELGGTAVITSLQQHLSFSGDTSSLACLSLSESGILRWYAACCSTPVANTARNPKVSYVGIAHTCVASSPGELERVFGPPGMAVNTQHAKAPVPTGGLRTATTMAEGITRVGVALLDGSWRKTPFFYAAGHRPVVQRKVLSADERARAREAVRRSGAR